MLEHYPVRDMIESILRASFLKPFSSACAFQDML